MRPRRLLLIGFLYAMFAPAGGSAIEEPDDYAIRPVPYRQVEITDAFWMQRSRRIGRCRSSTSSRDPKRGAGCRRPS